MLLDLAPHLPPRPQRILLVPRSMRLPSNYSAAHCEDHWAPALHISIELHVELLILKVHHSF